MKSKLQTLMTLGLLAGGLALQSCEKIELLPPPPPSEGQNGTGRATGAGLLFLQNNTSELFNADQSGLNITSDDIGAWVEDNDFARYDPNSGNLLELETKLPLWAGNEPVLPELPDGSGPVNILQPVPVGMDQTNFPGAFNQVAQSEWHIGSNWWVLDAQDIDYGWRGEDNTPNLVNVTSNITTNTTWTADKKYFLTRQIFVKEGATLTIEPGTVIFGRDAVGVDAGVLVVNRGARIVAQGTPDQPIVFTSTKPRGARARGDWGGLVLCGRAANNKANNVLIEGIGSAEANDEDGFYGPGDGYAADAADFNDESSGVLSFIRLEYAGIAVSPGNEVNSLTMGSIGAGTQVDHIIVTNAGDDGIECFGGTVDIRYIATVDILDDDLDLDAGYTGTIQYAYLVRNPFAADESTSTSFETSSAKNDGQNPVTRAVAANTTIVGPVYQLEGTDLAANRLYDGGLLGKDLSEVRLINSIIIGAPIGFQNP